MRRILGILLLIAAFVGLGLNAFPGVCHPEDEACEANPQHHAALTCGCSCHTAAMMPASVLVLNATALLSDHSADAASARSVCLKQPVPPPRS
jgi:hypothetical protein